MNMADDVSEQSSDSNEVEDDGPAKTKDAAQIISEQLQVLNNP